MGQDVADSKHRRRVIIRPDRTQAQADGGLSLVGPTSQDGPVVMYQRWRELLFLHWPVSPNRIAATLPAGLAVDTFTPPGQPPTAYLGVVPFLMERVRPRWLPPLPGVSWFGELNVRTYVIGPDGRPGVWFYSLDADQSLAVWLARKLFALPYHKASIRLKRSDRRVRYDWRRRSDSANRPQPSFEYHTPPADDSSLQPASPGTLEHFLVERYLLFSHRPLFLPGQAPHRTPGPPPPGTIFSGRVAHAPYLIAPVSTTRYESQPMSLVGFPDVGKQAPVSTLWSPGVDVRVHPLKSVNQKPAGTPERNAD